MPTIHCPRNCKFLTGFAFALALALAAGGTGAAPYIPTDDDIVLDRIPTTLRLLSRDRIATAASDRTRADMLETHLNLARRYIKAERDQGDPRYIGYALAALEPWSKRARSPVKVLMLRAVLRQRRHDFSGALADLRRVIAARPRHAQAHLTRAFILQATGRPRKALESCLRLPRSLPKLVVATCRARMESLVGESARAESRLDRALVSDRQAPPGTRAWALTIHGEIARIRGDITTALERLESALAVDNRDAYRRDAYADLLMDAGRPVEVQQLLKAEPSTDGHLLRRAIAANDVTLTAQLRRRLTSAQQRGDRPHLREAARLALHHGNQAGRALELALENWRYQREPWDARLVLESALAARKLHTASPVIAWMNQTGIEDRRLHTLLTMIKALEK